MVAGCRPGAPPTGALAPAVEPKVPAAATTIESTRPATLAAAEALCRPSDSGFLRAKLQGAITAELDWSSPATPQCVGGPRPSQDGLRVVYKGKAGGDPLLVIIGVGVGVGEAVTAARNVPASVTVVREGLGEFFATQGDDKCAIDALTQEPVAGHAGRYRLSGRGYCTQPARLVGAESGSVLVSRFDMEAIVEYPEVP
jgi:hypothetical protein